LRQREAADPHGCPERLRTIGLPLLVAHPGHRPASPQESRENVFLLME
jgi:hypothetical protein